MKKMYIFMTCICLTHFPLSAKADMWGADIPILTEILVNTIKQLIEMQNLVNNARGHLNLIREINKGINDSLNLARIIDPTIDPGIYRQWKNINEALSGLQGIYGTVVDSPSVNSQKNTDQTVAEAIKLNNELYENAAKLDAVAEKIQQYSHEVSPGGAQKLTAQSNGILVQALNQGLRAQATGLKLQAQRLAVENEKDKKLTAHILGQAGILSGQMKGLEPKFGFPRY